MITVNVRIDTTDLVNLAKKASQGETKRAVAKGLNDGIRSGRAEANRQIRNRYNIPLFEINRPKYRKIQAARVGQLSASLLADALKSVPIASFRGLKGDGLTVKRTRKPKSDGKIETRLKRGRTPVSSITRPKKRVPVSVEIIKGQRETMSGAFIAKMSSGHVGVFSRKNPGRKNYSGGQFRYRTKGAKGERNEQGHDTPIGQHYVLTLHKAIANKRTAPAISKRMEQVLPNRTEYWLNRLLSER